MNLNSDVSIFSGSRLTENAQVEDSRAIGIAIESSSYQQNSQLLDKTEEMQVTVRIAENSEISGHLSRVEAIGLLLKQSNSEDRSTASSSMNGVTIGSGGSANLSGTNIIVIQNLSLQSLQTPFENSESRESRSVKELLKKIELEKTVMMDLIREKYKSINQPPAYLKERMFIIVLNNLLNNAPEFFGQQQNNGVIVRYFLKKYLQIIHRLEVGDLSIFIKDLARDIIVVFKEYSIENSFFMFAMAHPPIKPYPPNRLPEITDNKHALLRQEAGIIQEHEHYSQKKNSNKWISYGCMFFSAEIEFRGCHRIFSETEKKYFYIDALISDIRELIVQEFNEIDGIYGYVCSNDFKRFLLNFDAENHGKLTDYANIQLRNDVIVLIRRSINEKFRDELKNDISVLHDILKVVITNSKDFSDRNERLDQYVSYAFSRGFSRGVLN